MTFRLIDRMPAAMLVWPASRSALIARLRRVAMTRGALPVRICERSSSKVTSLTQWTRFSMPQWPRTSSPSYSGLARSGSRLVMKNDVSMDDASSERFARSRVTRTTWLACGNVPSGSGAAETYLRSMRPCPRSSVSCSGGKRPSGEGLDRFQQLRLVRFDADEVVALSFLDDEGRVIALCVHRIGSDDHAGQGLPALE